MSLLDRFRSASSATGEALLGCWHSAPLNPQEPVRETVEMVFAPDGSLTYAVELPDRWQVILLTYRVRGDTIISNQPSAPAEERTRFAFDPDGSLLLENDGVRSRYRRGERRSPPV